ncbi:hypothetical protein FRC09_012628 [Ceratobasidium sp. 395]|nr:hypothetical protein FRC09_012628 [Ceratobasidium sp. 395]
MIRSLLFCLVAVLALVSAEQPTVCSPSQCIAGSTNVTLGATLSSVILLPGIYSLSSPVASILPPLGLITPTAESGITVSPAALRYPITVSLPAGALAYSTAFYAASATPVDLSSNLTSPRLPGSLAIPPNMAVTFRSPSSSASLVLFSSIPDTAQLPTLAADFSFSAVQATACAPACASGGACTTNGACVCAPGFTGDQCEQCLPGHFGSSCQQCADQCCDDGMSGSGRCLGARSKSSVETCACKKGTCASDGSCTCNAGWTNPSAGNSTKCSVCAPGFFLDPAGECQGTILALFLIYLLAKVPLQSAPKDAQAALRLLASARHVKPASLPIPTTVRAAFPLRPRPPQPVPTANSSTPQPGRVPLVHHYAKHAPARSRRSASRVAPVSLWAQEGAASQ